MPARRKFLRTKQTEESHIHEMVLMLTLAHPNVGFELYFEQRQILSVQPRQDIRTRAALILGKEQVKKMVSIEAKEGDIELYGLVAKAGFTRASRKDQRCFVNERPIVSDTVYFALREAYHTLVMKGRYPPVILFLNIPPDRVDVNVHPSKREVRFRDGRGISNFISKTIRQALRNLHSDTSVKSDSQFKAKPMVEQYFTNLDEEIKAVPVTPKSTTNKTVELPVENKKELPQKQAETAFEYKRGALPAIDQIDQTEAKDRESKKHEPVKQVAPTVKVAVKHEGSSISAASISEIKNLKIIGNLEDYLLAEGVKGLVLIDQKAAYERILFEEILHQSESAEGNSQGLLIPLNLQLGPADSAILTKYNDDLNKLGFDIEPFGGNSFIVNAVPAQFPQDNLRVMIADLIDHLHESPDRKKRPREQIIALSASRAASRVKKQLEKLEVQKLLDKLAATELPYTCPNGRPTMIKISISELDKRFGKRQSKI